MAMRPGFPLLALLAASMPLAGCLGGNDSTGPAADTVDAGNSPLAPSQTSGTIMTGTDQAGPGDLPIWQHGDWWTYDVNFDLGFGPLLAGESKVVVYDTANGYKVAAADRNAGIIDQHFDTFFVGDVGASLNPRMFGAPFQMFSFPLEDGKSWPATLAFFGGEQELTLMATAVGDAADPARSTPGFVIAGTLDDGTHIEYTYSPLARWVTSFELHMRTFDEEVLPVLTMKLTGHGGNYQGTFSVLTMDQIYFRVVVPIAPDPATQPIPPVDTVAIADGYTFIQRAVFMQVFPFDPLPAVGAMHVDMVKPDNSREGWDQIGEGANFQVLYDEPPAAGDWKVAYVGHGTVFALAGFWGFNEQIVEFTAASHEFHGGSDSGGHGGHGGSVLGRALFGLMSERPS